MSEKEKVDLIDDLDSNVLDIICDFRIKEIKTSGDWRWKIKMQVHKILPKSYHDYSITLKYDDKPILDSIRQLEKDVSNIGSNPSLFSTEDKKDVKNIDKRIADLKKKLATEMKECADIQFNTQTEEIKYKEGDTLLLFKVADTVIEPLNKMKFRLS